MNTNADQRRLFYEFLTLSKRPLIIVSDFDETIVSEYIFNKVLNIHSPVVKKDVNQIVSQLRDEFNIPIFICTARGSNDTGIKEIFKITKKPVVIENGGALFMGEKVKLLLSEQEIQTVKFLKIKIKKLSRSLEEQFWKKNLELVIRLNRSTDVEFRIQHSNGYGLSNKHVSELYGSLENTIRTSVIHDSENLKFQFSGSTLSIAPNSVSKANGIKELLKLEKCKRKEIAIVAFGDSENDISMMKFADFSVNVGNRPFGVENVYLGKGENSTIEMLKYMIQAL